MVHYYHKICHYYSKIIMNLYPIHIFFKCKVQYIRKEIRTDEICIGRIKTKKKIKIVQKKGRQTSKDQMGERILTQNPIRNII